MAVSKFFCSALAIVLVVASSANAATVVSGNTAGVASPGADGFTTYTLTATSDAGNIVGFNFAAGGAEAYGITGALRQFDPFGTKVIFNDAPAAQFTAAGGDILSDTHFLTTSASGIVVGNTESDSILNGAWNTSNAGGATPALAFAQVVLPNGATGQAFGQFTVATPNGDILETVNVPIGIPEPASVALVAFGLIGVVAARRRMA